MYACVCMCVRVHTRVCARGREREREREKREIERGVTERRVHLVSLYGCHDMTFFHICSSVLDDFSLCRSIMYVFLRICGFA